MYSVFEQCLNTTKSRQIVQRHDCDADASKVYVELIAAYEETLTTSLAATELRGEITLLRFDDSWKKGSEAFLLHWQGKILELEQLEDKPIEDSTKRLWLTSTLSTKTHMANCLNQAKVTELTLLGMDTTSTIKEMPWENFYKLILAHAKMHDHATPTKPRRETNFTARSGRGPTRGGRGSPDGGRNPGRHRNPPNPNTVYTVVTGPQMVMKKEMKFSTEEFHKLTNAQKTQLRVVKGLPPYVHRNVHTTTVTPVTPTTSVSPATTGASAVSSESPLRQVLSNKNVRFDANPPANQVQIEGHTYQRIVNFHNINRVPIPTFDALDDVSDTDTSSVELSNAEDADEDEDGIFNP
jgi:hypothetical protein